MSTSDHCFSNTCSMPEWISELFLKEPRTFGEGSEHSRTDFVYALGKKPLARIRCTASWRSSASTCFMMHDAAHMILHSELRQMQVCRNLFIAHTPGDQIHQFELPVGQHTLCTALLAGNLCPLAVFARQILNQSHAEFWGAGGLSLCHSPDGGDYFRG